MSLEPLKKHWSAGVARFLYFFKHIPIVGHLVYCTRDDHAQVFKEMLVTLLFSTATFWLTSVFLMGAAPNRAMGMAHVLHSTVKTGELFIFSVGFMGPILLITEWKKGDKEFPGRLGHIVALLIVCLVSAGFHSQIKSAQLQGKMVEDDLNFLFWISLAAAIAAVILRYLAMVYKKSSFRPGIELKGREADFAADYAKHARGEDAS